jgi:hypothetical protein
LLEGVTVPPSDVPPPDPPPHPAIRTQTARQTSAGRLVNIVARSYGMFARRFVHPAGKMLS